MGFNGMFSYPHCKKIQGLQVALVLIRLVDMGFSEMFSDPHCKNTGPTCGSGLNQTGGHGFQLDVLRSSL